EPGNPALESRVVRRDHMVLVVGPSHPLAGRTRVSVRELGAEAFIAHNVKTPARTGIVDFFASHETPLNISMEIATLETIKAFVERGVGVSFLPHIVVATDVAKGRLVEVEVDELDLYRIIRIVHRREHTLSPAAHAFLDLVSSGADESP
ncbi:MAG TPA: LysR substrate-binding domain-containing protein, partial [Blastocatellia bacterium]|nr:LysR substrate-binding domain-containing protein [Blastocatellia bacterium]